MRPPLPRAPAIGDAPRMTAATYTGEQIAGFLDLVRGADSVELKLTIPEYDQRSAIAALDMDPIDAEIRQVVFFDTPDLALNRAGVVVRARRTQRKGDDSVVKLRPVVPAELPKKLRALSEFGIEVDATPAGFVCSGSLKATSARVREAIAGRRPVHKLFTKEQRAFYSDHAPEGIELGDLAIMGPIFVLKLRFTPAELKRKMVAEVWLYPDESRILELSTKCAPTEAFQTVAETRAYLATHGVEVSGDQETKTKRALEFFSSRLGG
jgi:hypothetical protein